MTRETFKSFAIYQAEQVADDWLKHKIPKMSPEELGDAHDMLCLIQGFRVALERCGWGRQLPDLEVSGGRTREVA